MLVIEFLASQLGCLNGGYALPRGWGYQLCSLLSWRISGSQQYFVSGSQLLAANLRKCRTKSQRDAIYSLGGEAITTIAGHTKPVRAYIPLSFFTAPSNDGMDLPVASDILGSQIQITVQMEPPASIFLLNPSFPSGSRVAPPTEIATGYFQTEQLSMNDRAMSLASRPGVDMDSETYIQSLRDFTQQELVATLSANADLQTVTINGFMSGQVRCLQVYLTENNPANPMTSSLNWDIPDEIVCIFAGQQYAVFRNGSSEAWNLIDGTSPNSVDSVEYSAGASGVIVRPASAKWCILPFSQPTHNDYEATVMVSGLRITNGSVQLQMRSPNPAKEYTVHVVPVLNSALAYSRGSATLLIG